MKQVKFSLCNCSTIGAAVDVKKKKKFPRVSLGMLLLCIYYFVCEDTKKNSTKTEPEPRPGVEDFQESSRCMFQRPVMPFGGPGAAVKRLSP